MPKRGLMPNETACESSQMPAVAPPGETAPDLFPVSRATRKILSPFGTPPPPLCGISPLIFTLWHKPVDFHVVA